jgi:hypothetical protein
MSKELTNKNASSFAILAQPQAAVAVKSVFDAGLALHQLPKIKVPPAGMTVFSVEGGLQGEESLKEIDCVIAAQRMTMRNWYRQTDGALGTAPDCSSLDGRNGIGNNIESGSPDGEGVHNCLLCPWSKMGSDRKGGKGADCKEFGEVYCFIGQNRVPNLLKIPRSSKKAFTQYCMILMNSGHTVNTVVSKLTLKKVQNKAGQPYSEITFSFVRALSTEELAAASALNAVLSDAIVAAAFARTGGVVSGNDGDDE